MTKTPPALNARNTSSGCLYFLCMLVLGLWIVFYPRPSWLALGLGFLIPPIAFLRYRIPRKRPKVIIEEYPNPKAVLVANSAFLVIALAIRWWRDYTLIEPLPWAVATQLSAGVLVLLAYWYRPQEAMHVWRALIFAMYTGSLLGFSNMHFDDSAPEYVQGWVVAEDEWDGNFFYSYRFFVIAPYLHWDSHVIYLPLWGDPPHKQGEPICTARHRGALGMPWSSYYAGGCPAVARGANSK